MIREPWTEPESDLVRLLYPVGGIEACLRALPLRSRAGILQHTFKRLRLAVHRPPWTAAEDGRLRLLWGDGHSLAHVAQNLRRRPRGVYQRAVILGLPIGCPQGHEYFSDAAERVGYSRAALRHILAWHSVRLHPSLGLGKGAHRHHTVDTADVDEAVEAWTRTEPVGRAAARRGLCPRTVRVYLHALGLRSSGRRRHLRVTEEEVDRAMALRCAVRNKPAEIAA